MIREKTIDFLKSLWYNTLMNHNAEVYAVNDTQSRKYGYLFRTTSLRQTRLKTIRIKRRIGFSCARQTACEV